MRRFMTTVFDDFVVNAASATPVYTAADFNKSLGAVDKLAIQAVADQVTGTGPTLFVQIEHSGDGRNWLAKSGTPEINGTSIPVGSTTSLFASDAGNTPTLGFVRFKIYLGGSATPTAHVKLQVTGRDEG